MTREKSQTAMAGSKAVRTNTDLIGGLWEEATFSRLPWDAPAELRELVEEVENPHRVYAIHQASRRHNFQLIVHMYMIQLRDGCGTSTCGTSTCLSFRQRLAGKAPLRRYKIISARALAIHLASQVDPEAGLCPALRPSRTASAAPRSSVFSPKCQNSSRDGASGSCKTASPPNSRKSLSKDRLHKVTGAPHAVSETTTITTKDASSAGKPCESRDPRPIRPPTRQEASTKTKAGFTLTISNKASKDYRSFTANVFGTFACTMLEWLTPNAVGKMTKAADNYRAGPSATRSANKSSKTLSPEQISDFSRQPPPMEDSNDSKDPQNSFTEKQPVENTKPHVAPIGVHKDRAERDHGQPALPSHTSPTINVNTTVQSTSACTKDSSTALYPQPQNHPQRKSSVDSLASDHEDSISKLQSSQTSGAQFDDARNIAPSPMALKNPPSTISRPFSQLSSADFHNGVLLEKTAPLKDSFEVRSTVKLASAGVSINGGSDTSLPQSRSSSPHSLSTDRSSSNPSSAAIDTDDVDGDAEAEAHLGIMLPQTLKRLNTDVIDFICDVLQDDSTQEKHLLEPQFVTSFYKRANNYGAILERKKHNRPCAKDDSLCEEWRMFIEQSLFYILSDPRLLLRSFTKHEQLYDTQTLWYCMLRLTRAAPSIVLHSLWVAAKSLLMPSKSLLIQRLLASQVPEHMQENLLTDAEAGMLMSICLHALVAVAPVVKVEATLYDMSRIRSQGLSLAGSGLVSRQPAELCLQYDDAFSNDLALRLAKLLFSAISAQRIFNASDNNAQADQRSKQVLVPANILEPLFSQLDFLNFDAAYILNFSCSDRAIHETRMPTLLLDWARAVMLKEWTGSPVVPGDGHFGGALALVAAMYEKRHALLIGDVQFRSEYFAERLDELEMPVAWLTFESTQRERHLLDYPFIFSPTSLVSYFRSINFSRMNRAFEESSSLQSRMNAIISPGSLIINSHHKKTLQGLLKMASTKYLVLDIDRDSILQDAFDQLWRREQKELLRPLKVRLGEGRGEEGIDSGGVQHEFFRLALSRALDPNYGVFTVDGRTHMTWFNPTSLEAEWKVELIGLLVSLALFNGISLPVVFPKALYRKLLGEPVKELHHIADGWPDLVSGLTTLLEWQEANGAVEDIFVRTYEFSVELFGQPVSRVMGSDCEPWPMIRQSILRDNEGTEAGRDTLTDATLAATASLTDGNPGDDAPMVTAENRHAYVADYIQYLTDISVRPQYEAFARGFRKCLHPKSLKLLTPALLQSLLEGEQHIDMDELQQYTRYVGWDASHKTVRDFWSIVSDFDDAMKRKLLEFVTASDRMPVGGAKTMQFVLQRNGEEDAVGGHLPTAYTCYGIMLLPEYPSRQVLQERLAMALENSEGFGFS